MNIIIFIIILAVLILAHEFGHFIVAKKSGIRVDEFGIGFPPKLFGKKVGETEYTINAVPFGGFVRIFGENPDEESIGGEDSSRSFVNASKWKQIAVLCAGVTFNIILAWILISTSLLIGSTFSSSSPLPKGIWVNPPTVTILEVVKDSPASKSGILPGDKVISYADNETVVAGEKVTTENFQAFINAHDAHIITVNLKRGHTYLSVNTIPEQGVVKGKPAIGIAMDMVGTMKFPIQVAFVEGAKLTGVYTKETFNGIIGLLTDSFRGKADMSSVSGPVGIVKIVGEASKLGFERLLVLTAIISINLAVVNILPIPALDGGRVFFVLIETIKRSPIKPKFANAVNSIGFIILMGLIVVITFNDIWKLFAS